MFCSGCALEFVEEEEGMIDCPSCSETLDEAIYRCEPIRDALSRLGVPQDEYETAWGDFYYSL